MFHIYDNKSLVNLVHNIYIIYNIYLATRKHWYDMIWIVYILNRNHISLFLGLYRDWQHTAWCSFRLRPLTYTLHTICVCSLLLHIFLFTMQVNQSSILWSTPLHRSPEYTKLISDYCRTDSRHIADWFGTWIADETSNEDIETLLYSQPLIPKQTSPLLIVIS